MTQGFYKKQNNEIQYAPNYIEGNGYVLISSEKDTYEYPVDGWYWFNSEILANDFFVNDSKNFVTQRQLRLGLLQSGIDPDTITAMLSSNKAASIEWNYATTIDRQHPLVIQMGSALGKTSKEIDDLFRLAKEL
jgi:hypothetical protein